MMAVVLVAVSIMVMVIAGYELAPRTKVYVISEWEALKIAFPERNFTTLPPPYSPQTSANLTATLSLMFFYANEYNNSRGGGYNGTIIPVDNQTGLPTKPLAAYPNGPFESYGECQQYMYVWDIEEYPAPYSHGGSIYIDAVTGQRIGDLRGISFGLTCATSLANPTPTQLGNSNPEPRDEDSK